MTARLRVDPSLCMGARMCERAAAGLLVVGTDNIARVVVEELVEQKDIDAAVDAMYGCPGGAIEVDA